MVNPILYAVAGAAAYAIARRIYRRLFDPNGGAVDALMDASRRQTEQISILQRENEELRRSLGANGVPLPEPAYMDRVKTLASQGQKINAIKEYRAATGVNLKTAKDIVEAMAPPQVPTVATVTPASPDRIRDLVLAGNKIAAIRDYRQATGADLRTAKEYIEALARELGR